MPPEVPTPPPPPPQPQPPQPPQPQPQTPPGRTMMARTTCQCRYRTSKSNSRPSELRPQRHEHACVPWAHAARVLYCRQMPPGSCTARTHALRCRLRRGLYKTWQARIAHCTRAPGIQLGSAIGLYTEAGPRSARAYTRPLQRRQLQACCTTRGRFHPSAATHMDGQRQLDWWAVGASRTLAFRMILDAFPGTGRMAAPP